MLQNMQAYFTFLVILRSLLIKVDVSTQVSSTLSYTVSLESTIQESSPWNPESSEWSLESKTVLDSLTWGE